MVGLRARFGERVIWSTHSYLHRSPAKIHFFLICLTVNPSIVDSSTFAVWRFVWCTLVTLVPAFSGRTAPSLRAFKSFSALHSVQRGRKVCPRSCTCMLSTLDFGLLSSKWVVSSPLVQRFDNASAGWCSTRARWRACKWSLESRTRNLASTPHAFDRFDNQFRESVSIQIVVYLPPRYGLKSSTAHSMTRNSRRVVPYMRSAPVSDRDKYLISFIVLSGWSSNNIDRTWALQPSGSSAAWPSAYSNARAGGEMNFSSTLFILWRSFSISSKLKDSSFLNLSLSSNGILTKYGKSCLKTLHRWRNDFNSTAFHEVLKLLIEPVVEDAISERLRQKVWQNNRWFPWRRCSSSGSGWRLRRLAALLHV